MSEPQSARRQSGRYPAVSGPYLNRLILANAYSGTVDFNPMLNWVLWSDPPPEFLLYSLKTGGKLRIRTTLGHIRSR